MSTNRTAEAIPIFAVLPCLPGSIKGLNERGVAGELFAALEGEETVVVG